MTFYKLVKTMTYRENTVFRIRQRHCMVDVHIDGKYYFNAETGEILEPVFDDFDDYLIGFTDSISKPKKAITY